MNVFWASLPVLHSPVLPPCTSATIHFIISSSSMSITGRDWFSPPLGQPCMGSAAVFVIVTKCNYRPVSLLQHSLVEPHGDSWSRIVNQFCPRHVFQAMSCRFETRLFPPFRFAFSTARFSFVPCQQKRRGGGWSGRGIVQSLGVTITWYN